MLNLVKKIHKYKVSPSRLHIEITERILLCVSNIRSHLEFLRRHGLTIVIDDFGTGYSSYSYVADFPIDIIKIDRSLILKANTPKGFGLIKSIVSFCIEFNIRTVAEGVEDKECADICEALGIDLQQGYFYSHPELVPLTPEQS
jgi:EAL domain-containing protein (putative c-di-GMP-specific phosphodiesterase class I)